MRTNRKIVSVILALVIMLTSVLSLSFTAVAKGKGEWVEKPSFGDFMRPDHDKDEDSRPATDDECEKPQCPTKDEAFAPDCTPDCTPDNPWWDDDKFEDDDDRFEDDDEDDDDRHHGGKHHGYKPCATPDFVPEATPDFVITHGKPEGDRPADIYEIFGDFIYIGKDCDKDFLLIFFPCEGKFSSLREAFEAGFEKFDEVMKELHENGDMHLIGDANEDKELNIKDATVIQKCLTGLMDFSTNDEITGEAEGEETLQFISDFNRDGKRDVRDATAIQKRIAGLA